MDRPKGQSNPGFGIPGRGGASVAGLRGAGLAERAACGGGRFRMCWLVPEQRLITAWDPEGAPAEQGPRSGQIATREDGGVPGARSWPGQQGAA